MGNDYWNKEFENNVSAVKGSDSDVKSDVVISCRSSSAERRLAQREQSSKRQRRSEMLLPSVLLYKAPLFFQ